MMTQNHLKDMTAVALMTALLCVLGPVMIPIGIIPVSLQVLGVYLAVQVLGMKRGTLAVAVYLLIGFAGLPVFAGFSGGAARVFGPAGGFLVGFIPHALISGWFIDRFPGNSAAQFAGMFLALIVLYAFGTVWLLRMTSLPLEKAMQSAVYPFIAIDTAKILFALFLGRALRRRLAAVK